MHALTSEISSARLSMLSELIDARKRAEQQDQDFLSKMQRENAAFGQVAKLYEDAVTDIRKLCNEQVAYSAGKESKLTADVAALTVKVDDVSGQLANATGFEEKIASLKETVLSLDRLNSQKLKDLDDAFIKVISDLESFSTSLQDKTQILETNQAQLTDKFVQNHGSLTDEMNKLASSLNSDISLLENNFFSKIDSQENRLTGDIESLKRAISDLVESQNSLELRLQATSETLFPLVQTVHRLLDENSQLKEELEIKTKSTEIELKRFVDIKVKELLDQRFQEFKMSSDAIPVKSWKITPATLEPVIHGLSRFIESGKMQVADGITGKFRAIPGDSTWELSFFTSENLASVELTLNNRNVKASLSESGVWRASVGFVPHHGADLLAEISARVTALEDDGKSVFTFAGDARSVTPRRANWTQFTEEESPQLVTGSNPFED